MPGEVCLGSFGLALPPFAFPTLPCPGHGPSPWLYGAGYWFMHGDLRCLFQPLRSCFERALGVV